MWITKRDVQRPLKKKRDEIPVFSHILMALTQSARILEYACFGSPAEMIYVSIWGFTHTKTLL